jgi:hypothetical protein
MCPAWKIGSDSILMNLRRPLALVSKRNQRHAICSRLDPDPRGFVVDDAVNDVDGTLITMRPIGAASLCPACGALSGRVHSRYSRRLADLPIADRRYVSCFLRGVSAAVQFSAHAAFSMKV